MYVCMYMFLWLVTGHEEAQGVDLICWFREVECHNTHHVLLLIQFHQLHYDTLHKRKDVSSKNTM